MKRTIIFLIGLAILGFLSYFGAYHAYIASQETNTGKSSVSLDKSIDSEESVTKTRDESYYFVKIEDDELKIYEMPEKLLYDSVKINNLQFYEATDELKVGKRFETLMEVFELLENTMS